MEEYLRNDLLENANVDIFEFIKKAITVAATDHPTEFLNNKYKIFETLYSCIKNTSNVMISSTKNTQEDDLHKESILKASKTACDQPKAKKPRIRIVYRQGVAEVSRIKGILDKADSESEPVVICDLLAKLKYMRLTVNTLEVTGIGKTVNVLRKHASKEVSQIAGRLLKEWRDMVDEWLKNDASSVVHPDKENKTKGQVIADHESKDMCPKEVLIQDKTKRKPPMAEKENRTTSQRADNQNVDVVKKVLPVSKPVNLVAKTHESGINSQSLKNAKGLVIPHQQSKPIDSRMPKRIERSESRVEEKLEATKRKFGLCKDMCPGPKEMLIQDKTKRKPPMEEKENRTTSQRADNQNVGVVKKVLPVSKPVNLVAKTHQSGINSQSLKDTKGLAIPRQQSKPIDSRMPKRIERSESRIEEKLEATKRKFGLCKDMCPKEVLIQDKTKRRPPMEKENRTTSQRANKQTVDVVKKVLPVSKPVNLVAKTHQSGINSQSLKDTKGLVIPHQQSKPIDSRMPKRIERRESRIEEKLEATKRKLHQGYEDVENMKKKRRIQVLEFHELPKKGLVSKQSQHIKPQGHQLRRFGNAIGSLVRTY